MILPKDGGRAALMMRLNMDSSGGAGDSWNSYRSATC